MGNIRIYGGGENYNPSTSDVVLDDRQLFYSKFNNKLYIGDGVSALKDLSGTEIGLNIENGIGKHSIVQVPLQYGVDENGALLYGNTATGSDSIALGISSVAKDSRAVAIGNKCESCGNTSFTIGQENTNYGPATFTCGNGNIVGFALNDGKEYFDDANDGARRSRYSLVSGHKNKVRAKFSLVSGSENNVSSNSFPVNYDSSNVSAPCENVLISGYRNKVTNVISSLVTGSNNIINNTRQDSTNTTLSHICVVGGSNIVDCGISTVFGSGNSVLDPEGTPTNAWSFVTGSNNYTTFGKVNLLGLGLRATRAQQTIIGTYNKTASPNKTVFVVGNGTYENGKLQPSDAFKVKTDGSAIFKGEITSPTITRMTSDIQSSLSSAKDYTDNIISELNGTYKNNTSYRTVDTISQTDGKIKVSYKDIELPKTMISDLYIYGKTEGNSSDAKQVIRLWNPEPQAVYTLIATKYVNVATSNEVEKISHKIFTLSDVTEFTSLDGNSIQYIKSENKLEIIGNPGAAMITSGSFEPNTKLKLIRL